MFSSFVTDLLSAHASCMRQGFPSPSIERNPLLLWGEDAEDGGMQGNIVVPQWSLWLQILLDLHKWTTVSAMRVSWYDWAFTTAGQNPWLCWLQRPQAPAEKPQQCGWWVFYRGTVGPCLFYFINLTLWLTSTVFRPLGHLQTTGISFHFHIKAKLRWTFTVSNFIHIFLISKIWLTVLSRTFSHSL